MAKNRVLMIIIALVAILICAVLGYRLLSARYTPENTPENTTLGSREQAPDFVAYDRDGNKVNLSDFKGKPVVINIWASWCGPCKNELPHFEKFYQKHGDDVHFIMLDMVDGFRETEATGMEYADTAGYTFPLYFDSDGSAAAAYNVRGIPMTFFLDEELGVVAYQLGEMDEQTLKEKIEALLD